MTKFLAVFGALLLSVSVSATAMAGWGNNAPKKDRQPQAQVDHGSTLGPGGFGGGGFGKSDRTNGTNGDVSGVNGNQGSDNANPRADNAENGNAGTPGSGEE